MTRAMQRGAVLAWAAVCLLSAVSAVEAATATRTSSFEYDAATGLLTKEVIEPGDSNLCLVTTYGYDTYGNKVTSTTRNCNGTGTEAPAPTGDAVIEPRTSTTGFDAQGRFPTSATNALNHTETRVFDARFGAVTSLTGPNGLTTTWSLDGFGRKTLETRADGTQTQWDYLYCSGVNGGTATCPTNGKYLIQATPKDALGNANGAVSKLYYDSLNREIRTETQGFDGSAIYRDTQYDGLGRIAQVSKPYYVRMVCGFFGGSSGFGGGGGYYTCALTPDPVYWTTLAYDSLGRVITQTQPATGAGTLQSATSYNGLTVTVTVSNAGAGTNLPEGVTQAKTTVKNSQGQRVSVTDAQGNLVSYTYDPFGNLLTTTAGGVVTTLAYDIRGRKQTMIDPDMGTWSYGYDALGQLKRQTDAKGQVTTLAYDKLGRMTNRSEPDVINAWYYDAYKSGAACAYGKGKLCEVDSPAGQGGNGYNRQYSYDTLGRVATIATTIDALYTIAYGYDGNGRLASTTYPTGFVATNVYNALGYLSKVTDASGATVYWQANTVSATGQVLTETLGNGLTTTRGYDALERMTSNLVTGAAGAVQNLAYTYDTLGNLLQRVDAVQANLTEAFSYDPLDRLGQSSGAGLTTRTYTYDPMGNLTYKSDVGAYSYTAAGTACAAGAGGGPHALRCIAGTVMGIVNPSFSYDANGNLISGLNRTLTYASFNLPATVSAPNNLVPGTTTAYTYVYNAEHERVKHIIQRSEGTFTTIYLHPAGKGALLYEKEIKPTLTEHKHYLSAGGQLIGVYLTRSDGTTETRYFHRDQLGSLTLITNAAGAQIERLAYEAYGKRRNPNGTDDPNNTLYGATTDRGFTAHEHLDEIALIHMNGRIYDPLLGKFMTPDPFIQAPGNLQSYNRYAYGFNNPLSGIDPTGYGFLSDIVDGVGDLIGGTAHAVESVARSDVGKTIATIAIAYYTGQWLGNGLTASAIESGSSSAFANVTFLETQGTLVGTSLTTAGYAVAGAGAGFVGGFIASNGNINDAFNSALSGGISGGVSGYFGANYPLERIAANSVSGGIESKLRGGSFLDGARISFGYAALAYLNVQMRNTMIQQSLLDPRNDGTGLSRGMFGDLFKLAGGRWDPFAAPGTVQCSTLGCLQSGPGSIFGISYSKGSFIDMVVESFAGPHDMANSRWYYDSNGLIKNLAGTNTFALDMTTNYSTSLIFAAPFAVGAIYEQTNASAYRKLGNR